MTNQSKEVGQLQQALDKRAEDRLNQKLTEKFYNILFFHECRFGNLTIEDLLKEHRHDGIPIKLEKINMNDILVMIKKSMFEYAIKDYQKSETRKLLNDLNDFRLEKEAEDDLHV